MGHAGDERGSHVQVHIDPETMLFRGPAVDDVVWNTSTNVLRVGAVIGFALGQTWPSRPQDLGKWPAEAIEAGNLEELAEGWIGSEGS